MTLLIHYRCLKTAFVLLFCSAFSTFATITEIKTLRQVVEHLKGANPGEVLCALDIDFTLTHPATDPKNVIKHAGLLVEMSKKVILIFKI